MDDYYGEPEWVYSWNGSTLMMTDGRQAARRLLFSWSWMPKKGQKDSNGANRVRGYLFDWFLNKMKQSSLNFLMFHMLLMKHKKLSQRHLKFFVSSNLLMFHTFHNSPNFLSQWIWPIQQMECPSFNIPQSTNSSGADWFEINKFVVIPI